MIKIRNPQQEFYPGETARTKHVQEISEQFRGHEVTILDTPDDDYLSDNNDYVFVECNFQGNRIREFVRKVNLEKI